MPGIHRSPNPLLLALLAVLAAQPALADNECSFYGINTHIPSHENLDKIKAAGFDWIRLDFNWFQIEPGNNDWHWGHLDPVVDKAHSMGLNMFATLSYTPKWAAADQNCLPGAGGDDGCNPHPFASVGEWQEFVAKTVSRYQGKIKHWGMWNEPNLDGFYSGTPDQYVYDILIPGADAAKGADAGAIVCGPELAGSRSGDDWHGDDGTCAFGGCIYNGWELSLAEVLGEGGNHIDIITHHFYKDTAEKLAQTILDGTFDFVQVNRSLKEVIDEHGQGQQVWLTEWGWDTHAYGGYQGGGEDSPEHQAEHLVRFYKYRNQIVAGMYPESDNDPWPQFDKLFLYDYHDDVVGGKLWSFGILDVDGNPKPAYTALQDYFLSHPPDCDGPPPPPVDEGTGEPDIVVQPPDVWTPPAQEVVSQPDSAAAVDNRTQPAADSFAPTDDDIFYLYTLLEGDELQSGGDSAGGCNTGVTGSVPASLAFLLLLLLLRSFREAPGRRS